MNEHEWWAQQFEENRGHLGAVAYRMLGSLSEADDAVQEAWLRLRRSDATAIENLGGWLTTVVARVCLDILRSRASRREEALEAQTSEFAVNRQRGNDPEHEVLLADSVGLPLLVVLDWLTPAERIAFVLHDMFAVSFEEIVVRADSVAAPRGAPREIRGGKTWAKGAIAFSQLAVPYNRCWSAGRWDSYGLRVGGCRGAQLHDHPREDRPSRRDHRSGAAARTRPGGPQRVILQRSDDGS
jgi:DNA-directed RNA polymerase specialized sigma24 family protein